MLRIEKIDRESTFSSLKNDWNSLVEKSYQNKHFQRFEWYDAWWSVFAAAIPGCELNLYTVYEGEQLVAIAPLMRDRGKIFGLPARSIRFMGNSHSPRLDLIISREVDREKIAERVAQQLLAEKGWSLIFLRNMLKDDIERSTMPALGNALTAQGARFSIESVTESPYFYFETSFDHYLDNLDGHFRRNLKRRQRNLEKMGELKFEIFPVNGPDYRELLDEGLDLESNGWKGRNGSAIKSHPDVYSFYLKLCENFSGHGELFFHTLRLDGRLLAFDYCFTDHDTFHLNKIAYEEEFRKYSPGNLLKLFQIEHCFGEGFKEYDFLGVNAPWKMDWADKVRLQADLVIYNSLSPAGALLALQNRFVLPQLRRIEYLRKLKEKREQT